MKVEEKTYYEEEQKMDSKWIWIFALLFAAIIGVIGIAFLVDKEKDPLKISLVLGIIGLSDVLLIFLFKRMTLEIALSKKGFHYYSYALFVTKGTIEWNDISKIAIIKSPYDGYGKKHSFKNGQIFTMNSKLGVAIHLLNGKKKFFSVKDVDAFRTAYSKLQLSHPLEQ